MSYPLTRLSSPQPLEQAAIALLSLIGGLILGINPVLAIPGNQSDITGPNTADRPGPRIVSPHDDESGILDPQVLETAQRLSEELRQAYIACVESRETAAEAPRRFARGSANANAVCINTACQQLTLVTTEVRSFLSNLNQVQQERLRQVVEVNLW
jgi:hypothetical protein